MRRLRSFQAWSVLLALVLVITTCAVEDEDGETETGSELTEGQSTDDDVTTEAEEDGAETTAEGDAQASPPEVDPIPVTGEASASDERAPDLADFEHAEPIGLPPLELCDTDAPVITESSARAEPEVVELEDDLGGVAVRQSYTNDIGQLLEITAIAPTEGDARAGLDDLHLCLEAVATDEFLPESDELAPELEELVLRSTVVTMNARFEASGLLSIGVEDLLTVRDENSFGHSPTLEEIVTAFRLDADDVLTVVIDETTAAFGGDAADVVELLWRQPDVPFLDDSFVEANDVNDEHVRQEMADDDTVIVVYEFSVVDPNLEGYSPELGPDEQQPLVLYFYIDPPVNKRPTELWKRHYRAKCQTSAWAKLHAVDGRMTLKMWRKSPHYKYVGSRYGNDKGPADPNSVSHSSGSVKRSYDISVRGWQNGSFYHVDGNWTLGWGGGC